jgi:hypothetical protein
MTGNESRGEPAWRAALPLVCIIAGVVLILAPLLLPKRSLNKGSWSQEQAEKYQAASVKLHGLSSTPPGTLPAAELEAFHKDLKQAEQDYAAIRAELDSALARPAKITWLLRGLGMALLAIGGYLAYSARSS